MNYADIYYIVNHDIYNRIMHNREQYQTVDDVLVDLVSELLRWRGVVEGQYPGAIQ